MQFSVLVLALVHPLTFAAGDEPKSPLPAVLAKVGGEDATLEEYRQWLLDLQGPSLISDWLDQKALAKVARDRGCAVSEAEVDAAFETEWNTIVKLRFDGDESRFLDELAQSGYDRATFARSRAIAIRGELTLDRLCSAARDVSPEALASRFAQVYGDPPERLTVRVIQLVRLRFREQDRSEPGKPLDPAALDRAARAVGEELLGRLAAGEDFQTLAREHSHDMQSAPAGGLVEHLDGERFGQDVAAAARLLTPQEPRTGLIQDVTGYVIVELVSRLPVTFDEVRSELEAQIRAEPISGAERAAMFEDVRRVAAIERFSGR
jgi:hypothetical protein